MHMVILHLTIPIINICIPIALVMCMFYVARWNVKKSKIIRHDANSELITNMAHTQQGRHQKVLYWRHNQLNKMKKCKIYI